MRVVAFDGARLEASTFPDDRATARPAAAAGAGGEAALRPRAASCAPRVDTNREERCRAQAAEVDGRAEADGGGCSSRRRSRSTGTWRASCSSRPSTPPAPGPCSRRPRRLSLLVPSCSAFLCARSRGEPRVPVARCRRCCSPGALGAFRAGTRRGRWSRRGGRPPRAVVERDARAGGGGPRRGCRERAGRSTRRRWDVDPSGEPARPAWRRDGRPDAGTLGARQSSIRAPGLSSALAVAALALLALLAFALGLGGARTGATLVRAPRGLRLHRARALGGMLLLVFFPFFYGITLSFTDANIYNTNQPLADLWVGAAQLRGHPRRLRDRRGRRRRAGLQLPELLLDARLHRGVDGHQRRPRRHASGSRSRSRSTRRAWRCGRSTACC